MPPKKGGDTRAKATANGKAVGRPAKPKIITQKDERGAIAGAVLAMDGPPDHTRACGCHVCRKGAKNCECTEQCGDCHNLKENCSCRKYRATTVQCAPCKTIEDHKVCECEICRWWRHRLSTDKRIRYDADVYLTNRRDGKPAESVIAEGKLTIEVKEIRAGDHPAAEAGAAAQVM